MGFLFSPFGRVSLSQLWLYYLIPVFVANFVATFIDILVFGVPSFLSLMLSLFLLWPSVAVTVKRFHDHAMTGWWVLGHGFIAVIAIVAGVFAFTPTLLGIGEASLAAFVIFIPAAMGCLVLSALLYFIPGRAGGNQYGPDPAGRAPDLSGVVAAAYPDLSAPAPAFGQARARAQPVRRGVAPASPAPHPAGPGARPGFGRRARGSLNGL